MTNNNRKHHLTRGQITLSKIPLEPSWISRSDLLRKCQRQVDAFELDSIIQQATPYIKIHQANRTTYYQRIESFLLEIEPEDSGSNIKQKISNLESTVNSIIRKLNRLEKSLKDLKDAP